LFTFLNNFDKLANTIKTVIMKTKFYLVSALLIGSLSTQLFAQSNLGPKKPTQVSTVQASPNFEPIEALSERPQQDMNFNADVPTYAEIHTPIRWYALENAENEKYWEAVDESRIWIEMELGVSPYSGPVADFLQAYDLSVAVVLDQSPYKEKTNYITVASPFQNREDLLEMISQAQQVEGIKFIEPSVVYKKMLTPNDPLWEQQWGPYVTYFDEAWDYGIGGNSLNVVAVIDDACDWNHEDLYDQVWYGWDYAYDDWDITPDIISDNHGTHVTGTVAATINNGIGVAGMVNDTVYFAKVGDGQGGLVDNAIVNAVYDIADIARVTALNMSLGADAPSAAMEQACNYAWNAGKLPIVASGNNSQGFIGFPAAYASCMAVGSIGADGNNLYLTAYSQYGPEQEITAPGGDIEAGFGIISTLPGNDYGMQQGTSMAAPHVTGLAGLMKNLNPNLTNADIRNLINTTAFDYGDAGWDQYFGFGMINAVGAVEAAQGVSVGTRDESGSEFFSLYPNPAKDRLLIDMSADLENGRVDILDITGKVVMTLQVNQGRNMQIDVNQLNTGIYILRLSSDEFTASSKFIKS
jgi:subtilisin family serine protease